MLEPDLRDEPRELPPHFLDLLLLGLERQVYPSAAVAARTAARTTQKTLLSAQCTCR